MRMALLLSGLFAAFGFSAAADPEPSGARWSVQAYGTFNPDYVRRVGRGDYVLREGATEDDASFNGIVAFTATPDAPSVLLDCTDKAAFGVTFSIGPMDFSDKAVLFGQEGRIRGLHGEVLINGARYQRNQRFVFRRRAGLAYGVGREFAYRIVDAIYAGEPVTLRLSGQPEVTYAMPPPDEALAAFVRNCPAFAQD